MVSVHTFLLLSQNNTDGLWVSIIEFAGEQKTLHYGRKNNLGRAMHGRGTFIYQIQSLIILPQIFYRSGCRYHP